MGNNEIQMMLKDINNHKRPKDTLLEYFISYRLDKSVQTYYKQLLDSVDHLALLHDPDNVIVKMSREDLK